MSNLLAKLEEASTHKRPSQVELWLKSLDEPAFDAVWEALVGDKIPKTKLLQICNEEGGRFGKDSFFKFRESARSGEIKKGDLR